MLYLHTLDVLYETVLGPNYFNPVHIIGVLSMEEPDFHLVLLAGQY